MENLNMSTHEVYCSLDICKLLKEAGFDWECKMWVQWHPPVIEDSYIPGLIECDTDPKYTMPISETYPRPTLDVAQRWLREIKQCYVQACPMFSFDWTLEYYFAEVVCAYSRSIKQNEFKTYEEAQEAGIKKALEIILEKGE